MNAIFSFLAGWKGYAALAVLALAAAWGYGVWQYHAGYAAAERDQERQELIEFRREVGTLQEASTRIYNTSTTLQTTIPVLIQGYDHEANLSPLSADCGPISAGRLLNINAAIEKAATSRQSGRAVP